MRKNVNENNNDGYHVQSPLWGMDILPLGSLVCCIIAGALIAIFMFPILVIFQLIQKKSVNRGVRAAWNACAMMMQKIVKMFDFENTDPNPRK